MNFIASTNLPKGKVKYLVCDSRVDPLILSELKTMGISVLTVSSSVHLQTPVSAHADMNMFHIGGGEFITSRDFETEFNQYLKTVLENEKLCEKINNRQVSEELKREYPNDVLLNAVAVGEYIICNPKTVSKDILHSTDKEIISVKQGYTKCSTAVVSEQAIITDDITIYNSVKNKIDALLIEHGEVKLNGYDYGFIGGCTGKLSSDILAFSGDVKKSKYTYDIISFCRNHRVECISLSNSSLYDYGSLVPIIEA